MRLALLSGAAAVALLLSACGSDDQQDSQNLLAYVPADTPYVFANLEPFDPALRRAWLSAFGGAQIMDAYQAMVVEMASVEADDQAKVATTIAKFFAHLRPLADPDEATPLGMAEAMEVAIYGHGLLPVMRIRLADPAKFEAALAKIEESAESSMTSEEIGGYRVRREVNDEMVFYLAAINDQAVFALVPASVDGEIREQVLGLSAPQQSLADSSLLQDAAQRYGLDPSTGVGIIDTVRLAQAMTNPTLPGDAALMTLGMESSEPLDPVCQSEVLALAAQMPRMVTGYTDVGPKVMDALSIIEMPSDVAKSWATVSAPQPGNKAPTDAWAWFGMGVDPLKFAAELGKVADGVIASPYECEFLTDLNDSMANMKKSLNPMAVGMAANFKGLFVSLDTLEMGEGEMPVTGSGVAAISSPQPAAVWALVSAQMAELQQIEIGVDKGIVPVPAGLIPLPLEAKALMTDKSIALSLGQVADDRINAVATVDESVAQPVLRYGLSGQFYSKVYGDFMQQMLTKAVESARDAEQAAIAYGEMDVSELTAAREKAEREAASLKHMTKLMQMFGQALDFIDIQVVMTENGIEARQLVRLN